MLFIDEAGEGIEVDTGCDPADLGTLIDLEDWEVRVFLAQMLIDHGIPHDRVAKVLRIDRAGLEAMLAEPGSSIEAIRSEKLVLGALVGVG